jgi:hypothetical protein
MDCINGKYEGPSKDAIVAKADENREIINELLGFSALDQANAESVVSQLAYESFLEAIEGVTEPAEISTILNKLIVQGDAFINTEEESGAVVEKIIEQYESDYTTPEEKYVHLMNMFDNPEQLERIKRKVIKNFRQFNVNLMVEEDLQDENSPEAWQVTVNGIDTFSKLTQKLRAELAAIKQYEFNDEGTLVPKMGFLNTHLRYPMGSVFSELVKLVGNSPHQEIFEDKIKNNFNNPIINYLFDPTQSGRTEEAQTQLKNEIFAKIGQNYQYEYFDSVHVEREAYDEGMMQNYKYIQNINFTSSRRGMNKNILKAIHTNVKVKSRLYNAKGYNKKVWKEKTNVETFSELQDAFKYFGLIADNVNIPETVENVEALNQIKTNLDKIFSRGTLDIFMITPNPVYNAAVLNDIVNLVKPYTERSVRLMHKNSKGSNVYEFNKPNQMAKFFSALNYGRNIFDKLYSSFVKDPVTKDSLLLKKQVRFAIANSLKLPSLDKAIEYKDMSERTISLLHLSLFNGINKGFTIPNPIHSDASIHTVLHIEGKKLSKEQSIAEMVRQAKAERYAIENPLPGQKRNEHIIFPFLEGVAKSNFDKEIRKWMDTQVLDYKRYLLENNVIREITNKETGEVITTVFSDNLLPMLRNDKLNEFIGSYVYNYIPFYTDASIALNGLPQMYKSTNDFFKRAKQSWSPVQYSLPGATTRTHFNLKILKDKESISKSTVDFINSNPKFTEDQKKRYLAKFKKSSISDAQSYVDIIRYKEQQKTLGEWDQDALYDEILRGVVNPKPTGKAITQTKPFTYTQLEYTDKQGNPRLFPFQNKNSEFVILPVFGMQNIEGKPNPLYNPMYQMMLEEMGYVFDDNGFKAPSETERLSNESMFVDEFVFESAIKVGKHGIADEPNSESKIHSIPIEAWGKQVETPNHGMDDHQKMAVQVRKNIIKDIDPEETYDASDLDWWGGDTITGAELIDKLNELEVQNIQYDLAKLEERFETKEDLKKFLREELSKRDIDSRYLDLLDQDIISLDHPSFIYQIRQTLHSIVQKNVSQQRLDSGVAYTNLASAGFDPPQMVYNAEGGLDYYEAYAPVHNSFINRFIYENEIITADELKQRMVDAGAIEEAHFDKLVSGMIWRIPNEKSYSILPIKVTKFFPAALGGSVVLPPEITTITGADFDIDKMFGFYYHFEPLKLPQRAVKLLSDAFENSPQLHEAFKTLANDNNLSIEDLITKAMSNENINSKDVDGNTVEETLFKEVREHIERIIGKKELKKMKFVPALNERKVRVNQMMDIMRKLMSKPKVLTNSIYKGSDFGKISAYRTKAIEKGKVDAVDNMQFNLPSTASIIANRMLVGRALIGPIANANSIIALLQRDNLKVNMPVSFFGNNNIIGDSEVASDFLAMWSAAIVDNGKDPLAGDLNVNWATVNVLILLGSMGVSLKNIHDFLLEPKIKQYAKTYLAQGANFQAKRKAIEELDLNPDMKYTEGYIRDLNKKPAIEQFLFLDKVAEEFADVIRQIKVGESGLGKDVAQMANKVRLYEGKELDIKYIPRDKILKNKNSVHYALFDVIKKSMNIFQEKFDMINPFEGAWNDALNKVRFLKQRPLSVDEQALVINEAQRYMNSNRIPYNKSLVKNMAKRLIDFRKKYPEYENLLKTFYVESNVIAHQGITGELPTMREELYSLVDAMVESDNIEVNEFIRDLGYLAYYHDGFTVSPYSWSHLLTIKWHQTFANLETGSLNEREIDDNFVLQFVPNNFRKLSFIPDVTRSKEFQKKNDIELQATGDNVPQYVINQGKLYRAVGSDKLYVAQSELGIFLPPAMDRITGKYTNEYNVKGYGAIIGLSENDSNLPAEETTIEEAIEQKPGDQIDKTKECN